MLRLRSTGSSFRLWAGKNLIYPGEGGEKLSLRGQKSVSHWKNGGAAVSEVPVRGFSDDVLAQRDRLSRRLVQNDPDKHVLEGKTKWSKKKLAAAQTNLSN